VLSLSCVGEIFKPLTYLQSYISCEVGHTEHQDHDVSSFILPCDVLLQLLETLQSFFGGLWFMEVPLRLAILSSPVSD